MYNVRSRWLVMACAVALLPACGKNNDGPASSTASTTPAKTVLTTVHLIKQGQLDDLFKHVLPPPQYKAMRAKWEAKHAHMTPPSERDSQKYAHNMSQLTAPDAEQKLWGQIQPKLAKMDKQAKARMPLMIGMGQVMLDTQISNAKQLTPDQKTQATGVVDAIGAWAQKTDWTDPDHIKRAIGVVTATARKLDLPTLDQAMAMKYDQAMQKYAVVWSGLKQLFGVYGFSIDKTLDSATAKTLESDAHTATVRLNYTLLGKPQHLTVDMVKIDGRWYDKDLLDHWRKAMQAKVPVPGTPASAPAAAHATSTATPARS